MNTTNIVGLPTGIEDVLPENAQALEECRARVLDSCARWGYQLVVPPLVEYWDADGLGGDALRAATFRFSDAQGGKTLGLRADMTPQVARMDRQYFADQNVVRLCYTGTVLRTEPEMLGGSRSPIQAGAELYGVAGSAGDTEIVLLLCDVLRETGAGSWCLGLGHAGVLNTLTENAPWSAAERAELFALLQRKANADIAEWLDAHPADKALCKAIAALPGLCGSDVAILDAIEKTLKPCAKQIGKQLDELRTLSEQIQQRHPQVALHFDVGEACGFRYENGVVFAAYVDGQGQEIARGGRYAAQDDRPAAGFSLDLRVLSACGVGASVSPARIFAPDSDDPALTSAIAELRGQGRVVVCALQKTDTADTLGCTEHLVCENASWVVRPS